MTSENDLPEISLGTIARFLARQRFIVLGAALAGALLLAGTRMVRPSQYSAYASFIPQSKHSSSGAGLAAQLGLVNLSPEGSQSPQFFADLVTSPGVLRAVANTRFSQAQRSGVQSLYLADIYGVNAGPAGERVQAASKKLASQISTRISPKTGLIELTVRATDPNLASELAQRLIDEVNAVNLRLRQAQAAADKEFAETRVAELAAELRVAEERQQRFIEQNQDYRASPRLALEAERLARDVAMRESVYGAMASSYEQDRIESVRDNPMIAIVDRPIAPPKPDPRGILKGMIAGGVLGFLIGVIAALLREQWPLRWGRPASQAAAATLESV